MWRVPHSPNAAGPWSVAPPIVGARSHGASLLGLAQQVSGQQAVSPGAAMAYRDHVLGRE